jgi:transposase-like protein
MATKNTIPAENFPKTLIQAVRQFSDLDHATAFFAQLRWPDGVRCPHCGSEQVDYIAKRRVWQCRHQHAKAQFSVKIGTIFEECRLPIDKCLIAVWLEVNAKNSISSYEVARHLGVTQKTGWFLLHRIRLALKAGSFDKMGGNGNPVEADETYVGGLSKNMHLSRRRKTIYGALGGKTPVMGLLERHAEKGKSKVRANVIDSRARENLYPLIHSNVEKGANVFTDACRSYRQLSPDFAHQFVDHVEKYVEGAVHTNGLENFWCLFKRCIKGTHVSVDPVHLQAYVDSEAFRFNNRKTNDGGRFTTALPGAVGRRLAYKALIGQDGLEGRSESGRIGANA